MNRSKIPARRPPQILFSALLLLALCGSGCSHFRQMEYGKQEIEYIITHAAPELALDEVAVPFEITDEQAALAKEAVRGLSSDYDKAHAILNAIMDENQYGIKWENFVTATAAETINSKKGDCVSIASVYVALARSVGLHAYFAEALVATQESYRDSDFVVQSGHMTAIVETEAGRAALHIGNPLRFWMIISKLSDVEATAHFYNNRGFELLFRSKMDGEPINWEQSAMYFSIATRLNPRFAEAWNNLGVAHANKDKPILAEKYYRRAIDAHPECVSAHVNLGVAQLSEGQIEEAIGLLQTAVQLDERNPRARYHLARALTRTGQYKSAIQELEKSLELQPDHKNACTMLGRLRPETGESHQVTCIAKQEPRVFTKSYKTGGSSDLSMF